MILFVSPNQSLWSKILMAAWLIDWGKSVAKSVSKLRDTLASAGDPIASEDYGTALVQMMGLF